MPIVNPSETKEILRQQNIRLTKKLGQHFLVDAHILDKIIAAAGLSAKDTVLEIGPGIGALTEALAAGAGRVIALEYDRRFISILRKTLAGKENVEIIEADAMDVDFSSLGANVMVSNLPYSIGTAALVKVLEEAPGITRIIVMLQKEVANRIMAEPGRKDYGVLAITVGCYASARIIAQVKMNSFLPPPEVESTLVELTRLSAPAFGNDTAGFILFTKDVFASRRKTVKTALTIGRNGISGKQAAAVIAEAGIDATARAETLPPDDLFRLFRALSCCKS